MTLQQRIAAFVFTAVGAAAAFAIVPCAKAQTFSVIHAFTGGMDGANPQAGLTIDRGGNFYGTASAGGDTCNVAQFGCGVVFRMQQRNGFWSLLPLYSFTGGADGLQPEAPVVFGPDGKLYGTTYAGGAQGSCFFSGTCGTVFSLEPRPTICTTSNCSWILKTIYTLPGTPPPGIPGTGALTFDNAGNVFGTFLWDGNSFCLDDGPCGGVYELSRSGGRWNETTTVYFGSPNFLGAEPAGSLAMDQSGNLYGAITYNGAVYKLSYVNGSWVPTVLHTFTFDPDGYFPLGGLIMDAAGNLYGTTSTGGTNHGGTVFELQNSNGNWTLNTLYRFQGNGGDLYIGPQADLTMDASGNLYGTTYADGALGYGSVFKLSPSNGQWTFTSLHDFTGGSDGGYPQSKVAFDLAGHLYGTASVGGSTVGQCNQGLGCGVVWEITP